MSRKYKFERGLAMGDRLRILVKDPVFSLLVAEFAPAYGEKTKRSATNAKGMLMFGAATVLFGSDRAAEAEMEDRWHDLSPTLRRAGVAVSAGSPTASSWQNYRKEHLTEDVVAEMRDALRGMWANQAKAMGLFPTAKPDHDWMKPDHLHTVYADGTWFAPASRTGIRGQKSRAKTGAPRLSDGVSVGGKLDGYCSVWVMARRPEKRMRMILDFARAPVGGEIPVVINSLKSLRPLIGDGLRHFVYDRALRSHANVTQIADLGLFPITKPDGDAFLDWNVRGKRVAGNMSPFKLDLNGCPHRLVAAYGMLWDVSDKGKREDWKYVERMKVRSMKRRTKPDGSHTFDIDLRLKCGKSSHRLRVDLTEPLVVSGRNPIKLAAHLKPHAMAAARRIRATFGIRNDVESMFSLLKNNFGFGSRAGSYTRLAHEVDLLLMALMLNALTWAEWQQEHAGQYQITAA